MSSVEEMHGVPVMVFASEGGAIRGESDALDLIGDASYQGARWAVVPVERFADEFFTLRTRVAGDVIQKFAQYRMGLVVLGDISRHTEGSSALRDFVQECNRGQQTWFLADIEALRERLESRTR